LFDIVVARGEIVPLLEDEVVGWWWW